MSFESDCFQLVKLINEEEDWSILASEGNQFDHTRAMFPDFSISFIARKHNVTAGPTSLPKELVPKILFFFM